MTKGSRRLDSQQISALFPKSILEEIDIICKSEYISRASWLIAASKEKLESDRLKKIEKLTKISEERSLL